MTENASSWQKIENKSAKKKSLKPGKQVNAHGDSTPSKQQNGFVSSNHAVTKNSNLVNNMFDDFIEGGDGTRKKDKKFAGKGTYGTPVITGEDILKTGSVKSKFGETISFFTATASEQASKLTGTKKVPVKKTESKSVSYAVNFNGLRVEPIKEEIESLADIDQVKKCLSLAVFLNIQKTHQDQAGWETKSFESGEPLSNLPKDVEKVLKSFIQSVPESAAGASFELVLAELISKCQSPATTWGYKVILQLLGRYQPEASILKHHKNLARLFANIISNKTANVVTWALLQPIVTDPVLGLRIWCRILLPSISNKGLAPSICAALDRLMSIDALFLGTQTLAHADYFPLLDYTFPQPGLQNLLDLKTHRTLQSYYPKLKMMAAINTHAIDFFSSFLMRYKDNQSKEMLDELLNCIVLCLRANPKCYEMWVQMFDAYSVQSSTFLTDLICKWEEVPELPRKDLNKFLDKAQKTLEANPNGDGLSDTIKQFKDQLHGKPRKKVTFGSKSDECPGVKRRSGLLSKLFRIILIIAFCATAEYIIRGQESTTKVVLEATSRNMIQLHNGFVRKYPKEAKYIMGAWKDATARVRPKLMYSYNTVSKKLGEVLDFVYRDGPVRLSSYLKKEVYPSLEWYYLKHWQPTMSKLSRFVGENVKAFVNKYNLETLLRPYVQK